jgi:hypothetical protein
MAAVGEQESHHEFAWPSATASTDPVSFTLSSAR